MRWLAVALAAVIGLAGLYALLLAGTGMWMLFLGPWWRRLRPGDDAETFSFLIAFGTTFAPGTWPAAGLVAGCGVVGLAAIGVAGFLALGGRPRRSE